jgi:Fur family ferric uptake transcriptional regulator
VILEEVEKSHDHLTADEIYQKVKLRLPRISMGTVYRNLEVLAANGIIKRLGSNRPQMRFEGNIKEHYHLTCLRCGSIEDVPFKPTENSFETLENALGNLTKYGIFAHNLEFFGLCARCLEEAGESTEKYLENYLDKRTFV